MSSELSEVLQDDERKEWNHLRQVVGDSLRDWCEALRRIRDKRLYREDYPTFEDYCQIELGKTRRRINQVLNADMVRVELEDDPSLGSIASQISTRAAEEIAKAPAAARKEVAKKAVSNAKKTGKPPTAKIIKKVVAEVVASRPLEPDVDDVFRKCRSLANQFRDKLVRAIDDCNQHKPNIKERDRLVRLVQSVEIWG